MLFGRSHKRKTVVQIEDVKPIFSPVDTWWTAMTTPPRTPSPRMQCLDLYFLMTPGKSFKCQKHNVFYLQYNTSPKCVDSTV